MFTIYETLNFVEDCSAVWTTEERLEFFSWIAANPEAGVVVPGSGGCRKVRWSRLGTGKRGGVRVIYFVATAKHELWMLMLYAKSVRDNFPAHILKQLRKELEDD